MADLRVSDVIVPEVFSRYLTQDAIKQTTLYRSGILRADPRINEFLAGGGETFNIPFWNRLSGDVEAIQSDFALTPSKTTTDKQVARRLFFGRGWGAEDLADALSGEDAMGVISSMVGQYWDEQQQRILFAIIKGIIADNVDNDDGSLVKDITTSGTPGTSNKIGNQAMIDSQFKLGDAGSKLSAIAMHSTPYATLCALNLITFVPTSAQNIGFGTYLGKTVIVTDELAPDTDGSNQVYWNILFSPGSVAYGESARGIVPVETYRNAARSEDELYTRRQFAMHPMGFKWLETSVVGNMPTRNELEEAGNWDRVDNIKNCGIVVLKTNG